MDFYPIKTHIPTGFSTTEYLVRPLLTSDVTKDYEAVMASKKLNLRWTEGRWPRDGFTIEENLEDLEYHHQMHEDRKEFTFTIMDPDNMTCLGCIYFKKLYPDLISELNAKKLMQDYIAIVFFWLRPDMTSKDFNKRFFADLINWINSEWKFNQVYYFIRGKSSQEDRKIFLEFGMEEKVREGNNIFFA